MTAYDENDLLQRGALPSDPLAGAVPMNGHVNGVTLADLDAIDADAPAPSPPPESSEREPAKPATPPPWDARVVDVGNAWFVDTPPPRAHLLTDSRREGAGYLPIGEASQFVAGGGLGKTMAEVQLAVSITTGAPWLGTFDVVDPGPVLLVLGEEKAAEVHRRIYRASRAIERYEAEHGRSWKPPRDGMIVTIPLSGMCCAMLERDARGNATTTPFYQWLHAFIAKRGGFRFIAIDPLSRFAGTDAEKDNAIGTRFVEAIEALGLVTNATTSVAHHTNALSRGRLVASEDVVGRGVTALHDGFRWQATLSERATKLVDPDARRRLGSTLTLTHSKSNYTARAEPLVLRRLDGGALFPLDANDLKLLEDARRGDEQRAKAAAEREAERDRKLTEREKKVDERRLAKDAAKEAELRAKIERADSVVRALLLAKPDLVGRALRAEVKKTLACASAFADEAIARVRPKPTKQAELVAAEQPR